MNKEEMVSVILPAYKSEEFILNSINSVVNQEYKNIELIVIENGPKGKLEEMLSASNYKSKVKYFYEKTANVSKARNIGLKNATGKYIAFIDADDKYKIDFLSKMVKSAKLGNELVTSGYIREKSKKKILILRKKNMKEMTDIRVYLENLKIHILFNEIWNKLYLNEIIKKYNLKFDESAKLGEDMMFNIDYISHINKASYIDECLYIYNDAGIGLNSKYWPDRFEIEYKLTEYLQKMYEKKNYPKDYIYNCFARIYCRGVLNIYNKGNKDSKKQKDKDLKEFINQEKYKKDLEFLNDKITNKIYKFIVKNFLTKNFLKVKLFVFLNSLRGRR